VFNDHLRDALAGSVFHRDARGFASASERLEDLLAVRKAVLGSLDDFAAEPTETVNYVTSHDNMTLWDKIAASNGEDAKEERIRMDLLAQAIVFTSQGVAFLQGGEEFLRTKGGHDNSYNAGDGVNRFDWSRKAQYEQVFRYYQGLIELRRQHPAFRMTTAEQVRASLHFLEGPAHTVAFLLNGHANGDRWGCILVVYNANRYDVTMALPPGTWTVVGNGLQIGTKSLGQAEGSVVVERLSCAVLHLERPLERPQG
jgi:pullulanase